MTEQQTVPLIYFDGQMQPAPEPEIVLPAQSRVDPELLKGAIPPYTDAEVAELLSLLNPMRLLIKGEWVILPLTLDRLRQSFQLYCDDLQDRLDAEWRSTGAYLRAVDTQMAEQREEAREKRYQQARDAHREEVANKRMSELMEHGLTPRAAADQVRREFPEQ